MGFLAMTPIGWLAEAAVGVSAVAASAATASASIEVRVDMEVFLRGLDQGSGSTHPHIGRCIIATGSVINFGMIAAKALAHMNKSTASARAPG
jgi:hypothetical protein